MDFPNLEKKIKERIDHLNGELQKIRSGRAHPGVIEDILVDYFGAKQPVKALGSIRILGPQTLAIDPWDKNALDPIASAISKAENGLQAVVDGNSVRVPFPSLSEERRGEFVKLIGNKAEDTKIQLRQLRDEELKELKEQKTKGQTGEDDFFRAKEKLEKIFKENFNKIDETRENKEKEILTI